MPDVVVMDVAMTPAQRLEATRQIIKEVTGTRVLVLSSYSDDEYVPQVTRQARRVTAQADGRRRFDPRHPGSQKRQCVFSVRPFQRMLENYLEAFFTGSPPGPRLTG